jgi:NAD(P)-dependent dehydrogenase (short-subunit alcohol dehydrogenase family)
MQTQTSRRCGPGPWLGFVGKTVLVCGASGGIGRACSLALANAGADVVVLARGTEPLQRLVGEIETDGGSCRAVVADVTDITATREALAGLPRIDAVVNCAGRNLPEPIGEVTPERFDAVFDLNIRATFFLCREAVLNMRRHAEGGAIVNVSSQMGHVGAANRTVYCASKHAIEGLTKALAVEVARDGIRVNSVCPTFIETPMTAPMFSKQAFRDEVVAKIPMGRVGTPDEVTGAVLFLLSDAAALITGTSLLVDGGWTAQ